MRSRPIRRGQLVAPFGVGAMVVVPDGTSLIAAGLDHWYEREDGDTDPRHVDDGAFRVDEWRLARRLGVDHLRLPPDFREWRRGEEVPNVGLTVPFLRFPQWHFCSACYLLVKRPLTERGRVKCPECDAKNKRRYLAQVPFIAMCDAGHVQDFPWREWVHRSANPSCDQKLRLRATGGASLSAQQVSCDCKTTPRTLAQITSADSDGSKTYLSDNLADSGGSFACQGRRPWLGTEEGTPCSRPLRGSLRSASNAYFGLMRSAIYLPRRGAAAPAELVSLLEEPPLSSFIQLLAGTGYQVQPKDLRDQHAHLLHGFSDDAIAEAIGIVQSAEAHILEPSTSNAADDPETAFRRAEFETLRASRHEEQLAIREVPCDQYDPGVMERFSRITLVEKLRETRALAGFSRVLPKDLLTGDERNALLWRRPPSVEWLPAYVVYGEGIFLELDERSLQAWERGGLASKRVQTLVDNYERARRMRQLRQREPGPRFVLLHTLAHLIMNRLSFECGYSSAALRERLYVSSNPATPMAGILIYTAAGDAEGTMGGLVRMGRPGYLEPVIRRAVEEARWCSADPVCMEMARYGGQGPDSCNLAACHNCALVPETACEEFNRFLDRGLVVGDITNPSLGFLTDVGT